MLQEDGAVAAFREELVLELSTNLCFSSLLGAFLGPSRAFLGPSRAFLGPSRAFSGLLGPSRGLLGPYLAFTKPEKAQESPRRLGEGPSGIVKLSKDSLTALVLSHPQQQQALRLLENSF